MELSVLPIYFKKFVFQTLQEKGLDQMGVVPTLDQVLTRLATMTALTMKSVPFPVRVPVTRVMWEF